MSPLIATKASASARGFGFFGAAGGPAAGFEPIATVTASGGESSLTFSSIPQTYASLQIRGIGRVSAATTLADMNVRFNSDTGSNYSFHWIRGSGASASVTGAASYSSMQANDVLPGASSTSGIYGTSIIDVHDYAATTRNKTLRWFTGNDQNGSGYAELASGLWMNTSAITQIMVFPTGNTFAAGSTFALYGIKAGA